MDPLCLPPPDAQAFLDAYQRVLLEAWRDAAQPAPSKKKLDYHQLLLAGRDYLFQPQAQPARLDAVLARCAADGHPIAGDMQHALRTLRVRRWVFLKELTRHAVFLDDNEPPAAWAVHALTQPLSAIIGGSGAMIETGVCEYRGRFVCDGLISELVWLGPSLRRSAQADFSAAKTQVRFWRSPEAPAPAPAAAAPKPRRRQRVQAMPAAQTVLEAAPLHIKPGQAAAFEAAFAQAQAIIASMPGYLGHELQRCLEQEHHYLLLVRWRRLQDHTEGFRGSPQYQQWKALLHHFYDPFPTVLHYQRVLGEGL